MRDLFTKHWWITSAILLLFFVVMDCIGIFFLSMNYTIIFRDAVVLILYTLAIWSNSRNKHTGDL